MKTTSTQIKNRFIHDAKQNNEIYGRKCIGGKLGLFLVFEKLSSLMFQKC